MRAAFILAAVLVPLLLGAIWFSIRIWGEVGDTEIGTQGYIALGLGVLATLVVGGGLMGLVFYSSRHGYDERAGRDPEKD
jgi:hypothetical protein